MNTLKPTVLAVLLSMIYASGKAQFQNSPPTFDFTRLVYHSSHCNGTCPAIDMEIDRNRNILLHREIWSKKGETDENASGYFKGRLDADTYAELEHFLSNSGYYNWIWPEDTCCDAVITTIIIHANGKRTRFISMTPPNEAKAFIDYLFEFGMNIKIPRTDQHLVIEK